MPNFVSLKPLSDGTRPSSIRAQYHSAADNNAALPSRLPSSGSDVFRACQDHLSSWMVKAKFLRPPVSGPQLQDSQRIKACSQDANIGKNVNWSSFVHNLRELQGASLHGNSRLWPLVDAKRAFTAMLGSIDRAQSSVDWVVHIFDPDESGWKVAEKLAEAAQRGCKVRLLLDETACGSALRTEKGRALTQYLQFQGVKIATIPTESHHCNHRKVLLVDKERGFTGGMNVGNFDRDSHDFQCMVQGEAVSEMDIGFQRQWKSARPLPSLAPAVRAGRTPRAQRLRPARKCQSELLLLHHQGRQDTSIKQSYLQAIATAKDSILIVNPYITDPEIFQALKDAADRGVSVKLVLPKENDYKTVERSMRSRYQELIKAKVEIFEYPGRHVHGKVAVFDRECYTIGSSNLDRLSLEYNDELNIWAADHKVSARLASTIESDIARCESQANYQPNLLEKAINHASDWLIHRI